jgi:hypothetical protein
MMFLMNSDIDVPVTIWEEMFLPLELEASLNKATYKNSKGEVIPLVASKSVFHKATARAPVSETSHLLWPWMSLLGVLFGGLSILLGRRWAARPESKARRVMFGLYHAALGAGFGGAATALLLMWTSTDHVITYHHENIIWVSPFILLSVVFGVGVARAKPKALARLRTLWLICAMSAVLGAVLKVTPWFTQQNTLTIALMVPFLVALVVTVQVVIKPLLKLQEPAG